SSLTPHPPPAPTLFPYTTLFRSGEAVDHRSGEVRGRRPGAGIDGLGDLLPVDGHGNRLSPQPAGLTGEVRVLHVYREGPVPGGRSEEHTSELQSRFDLVCRLLLE